MDVAIADIAIFARDCSAGAADNPLGNRVGGVAVGAGRVAAGTFAGYAGATPVALQMRGLDLPVPFAPDLDLITAITDTAGQVTSSYFTNIASSTLAFMYVPGTGVMVYKRRLELYDRALPQWAVGENAALPVNANTLATSSSLTGWTTGDGATLVSSSLPSVSPLFEFCGLFHGDGSTPGAFIFFGGGVGVTPVTAGELLLRGRCRLLAAGLEQRACRSPPSSSTRPPSPPTRASACHRRWSPGSLLYMTTPVTQAPATSAFVALGIQVVGTPASSVQFYVTDAVLIQVPFATPAVRRALPLRRRTWWTRNCHRTGHCCTTRRSSPSTARTRR